MTTLTAQAGTETLQDVTLPVKAVARSLMAGSVVVAGAHGTAMAGNIVDGPHGVAVVGTGGRATSCFGGAAVAFDAGLALSGALGVAVSVQTTANPDALGLAAGADGAVAVAGQRARAATGSGGIAIARAEGLVYGGYDSLLVIDTGRLEGARFVIGRTRCPAKDGATDARLLEPNTFYEWDGADWFDAVETPPDLKAGPPYPVTLPEACGG